MMVCITVSVVISVIASLILGVLITGTLVRRVMDLAFDSTEFCMKTLITLTAVSYTHLEVYKRQFMYHPFLKKGIKILGN